MQALGHEKPIIATEYGGPGFFEFFVNLQFIPLISAWSQAAAVGNLEAPSTGAAHRRFDRLPLRTHEHACPADADVSRRLPTRELDEKLQRLQSREIAIRNVLALSAGVERTAYWQLLTLSMPRDNLMQLMYGKIGMLTYENGAVTKRFPVADAFERTARVLAGVRQVKRIELPENPTIHFFKLDRGDRGPAYVIWDAPRHLFRRRPTRHAARYSLDSRAGLRPATPSAVPSPPKSPTTVCSYMCPLPPYSSNRKEPLPPTQTTWRNDTS